ncbi:hypothetical protein ISS03_03375 [Patescibacteria group bacterium]|nr:hypothetical protein [Patescibacteria group bacterium]
MFKFSEQLRKEAIEYFSDVCHVNISHEEADEYLRSLSSLCSALIDF